MPPHAIHGVVYDRPWRSWTTATIAIDLDERWPFRGRVTQRFALDEDGLEVTMTLRGRRADARGARLAPVVPAASWRRAPSRCGLAFQPGDDAGPRTPRGSRPASACRRPPARGTTRSRTSPADPVLEWPGQLRLEISSTCAWWVVYTMPEHAICVEPQSGPPDGARTSPGGGGPGPTA